MSISTLTKEGSISARSPLTFKDEELVGETQYPISRHNPSYYGQPLAPRNPRRSRKFTRCHIPQLTHFARNLQKGPRTLSRGKPTRPQRNPDDSPWTHTPTSNFREKPTRSKVDILFLVLPSLMACHCVIGRMTLGRLEAVTSTVHMKMKLYFDNDEVVTLDVDRRVAQSCSSKASFIEQIGSNIEVYLADLDARYEPHS